MEIKKHKWPKGTPAAERTLDNPNIIVETVAVPDSSPDPEQVKKDDLRKKAKEKKLKNDEIQEALDLLL